MRLTDYIHAKPVVATERLLLRPLVPEDVPALREWTADRSLYAYWGKSAGRADKDPSLLFAKAERPAKSFHWGIQHRESGKIIGEVWIYLIENDRMAKAALRVAPKAQGRGYASEALAAAVRFCFEKTELRRIWTDVDVRNAASCRVLEKCGFTREGMVRQGKMVSTWCDYYLYGMLREDFTAQQERKRA
jgi:ribosomal-protein-alanine N-acetyltransferase